MKREKKVLGVIGGLGPWATAHFLELVLGMTEADSEQENLDMIVYNFPSIPDRTGYILGSNLKSPLPGLLSVARDLDRQKVCCIAVPCITAHFFYEDLSAAVTAPILNAVTETAARLQEAGITEAGIMATDGTLVSGLLNGALARVGIHPILPSRQRQRDVMSLIYDDIKAGKPADMEKFHAVSGELRDRGAQTIVLGCTELSLIKRDENIGPGYLDTMEVLARASVLECGKALKKEYRELISRS